MSKERSNGQATHSVGDGAAGATGNREEARESKREDGRAEAKRTERKEANQDRGGERPCGSWGSGSNEPR